MATPDDNVLDGMGDVMLSLARKHSNRHQWSSWLKTLLLGAALDKDATMVLTLLKAGAGCLGGQENDGMTPLHAAAQGGSLGVVTALLKGGAIYDVDSLTYETGRTPIFHAVKCGNADVALALVRAGGDLNITEHMGWNPLMCAVSDGRVKLVTDLLLAGSYINVRNNEGTSALDMAVQLEDLSMVKVLLQADACPGTRGKNNRSAVDLAAEGGNTEALVELLASGPNLDILDDNGKSALLFAVRGGQAEVIDILINAGADPNAFAFDAGSPLHLACSILQPRSVEALLRLNADELFCNDANARPEDVVAASLEDNEINEDDVDNIYEMLERVSADRVWRRRGWLLMLWARKRRADEELMLEHQQHRNDHEDEAEDSPLDEGQSPSALRSRRKLACARKRVPHKDVDVHSSLKRIHWTVTKMVDVADELILRKILSYV